MENHKQESESISAETEQKPFSIWEKTKSEIAILIAATMLFASCEKKELPEDFARSKSVSSEVHKIPETEAERVIAHFPEHIQGLHLENVYLPEKTDKVIVFIRQAHLKSPAMHQIFDSMSSEAVLSELERTTMIEKDVYDGLKDLQQKTGIQSIYAEGIDEHSCAPMKRDLRQNLNLVESFFILPQLRKALRNDTVPHELLEKYKMAIGAEKILYSEGMLELNAGENSERNHRQLEVADNYISHNGQVSEEEKNRFRELVLKAREDFILKEMVDDPATISVCVFGGSHDFRKETREINKSSAKKICLITLTPDHYDNSINYR